MGIVINQREASEPSDLLPTGDYIVKITEIKQVKSQFPNQRTGELEDQLLVGMQTRDGKRINAYCSMWFSPKSKLYSLVRAAFGREIPVSYNLDTDELIGRKVKVVVLQTTSKNGKEYSKVVEFKQAPPTGAPTTPARPAQSERKPEPQPEPPADDFGGEPF